MSYGLKISASVYIYITCPSHFGPRWAPAPPGFKMASPQLPAYRAQACGARIIRGLDESVTKFYQGRLTTALRLAEFV